MVWLIHPRIHQLIRDIVEFVKDKRFKNKDIRIDETILVAGSARSGTTWLMSVLNTLDGYSSLFEPLNPDWFLSVRDTGFEEKFYLDPDEEWDSGEDYFQKLFTGKIKSEKAHFDIHPKNIGNRLLSDKILIKIIRGNKILPWIGNNFDLRGVIYFIRHPCAVIASQIRTEVHREPIPSEDELIEEISSIDIIEGDVVEELKGKLVSKESRLAAIWCVDNYVPLRFKDDGFYITVRYEDLVVNGKEELDRIFDYLSGTEDTKKAYEVLGIPSGTTEKDTSAVRDEKKMIEGWKEELSEKQIKDIEDVVSVFGIDLYEI